MLRGFVILREVRAIQLDLWNLSDFLKSEQEAASHTFFLTGGELQGHQGKLIADASAAGSR
jgi:hypothetical protein